jgi:hypothetical protein
MSAWKKPSRNTWVKKISTPARDSCGRSTPWARSASICEIGVPCMRSITITLRAHQSQCTSGSISSVESAKLRRSCEQLAASRIRSSSSCRYLSNSATTSRGFRRRPSAQSARAGRRRFQQRDVVRDDALDARAQDLDRDLAAVGQLGEVHLRHRGRGHRLALEVGEHLVHRLAVGALQLASACSEGRAARGPAAASSSAMSAAAGRAASTAPGRT